MNLTLFLITLLISIISSLIITITANIHDKYSSDSKVKIQDAHIKRIPRIGGIALFISFIGGILLLKDNFNNITNNFYLWFSLTGLIIFIIGLIEDFTAKLKPSLRLIFIILASSFAIKSLNLEYSRIGINLIDQIMDNKLISLILTIVIISGFINSFNVVDGLNGLISGYCLIISILIIITLHYQKQYHIIIENTIWIFFASVTGFFIFNFPFGKIFLGDSGAYLIGFYCSIICLYLIKHFQYSPLSIFYLLFYPGMDLLFSVVRKNFFDNISPMSPDNRHFHHLFLYLVKNKLTTVKLTLINSISGLLILLIFGITRIPYIFFYSKTNILSILLIIDIIIYVIIYLLLRKFYEKNKQVITNNN